MNPPESYSEPTRLNQVHKYLDLPHWHESHLFKKTISKLRKTFQIPGVAISLIDTHKCHFKIETVLDMKDVPRSVAIDSHAILSSGYFCLLDASKDWRTRLNPLVTGLPNLRFWCGVPLLAKTSNGTGVVIGILSIFDSFPKEKFPEENCKILQSVSREIMTTLNCHIEEVRSRLAKRYLARSLDRGGGGVGPNNNELSNLRDQIGRPTSSRSLLIFEKDGSGGPYLQNQNFRFLKYNNTHNHHYNSNNSKSANDGGINEKQLWDTLFSIGSLKQAANSLSKIIATSYGFEFVYILEIRIAEPYQIPKEYFPHNETKIEAENYRYTNKMIKTKNTHDEFMTRVIGVYQTTNAPTSPNSTNTHHFENPLHYKAFINEFGVEYKNPKLNTVYNRGLLIPFYRHNSRIVRRSSDKDKRFVDVYLRSGGYLIGMFSETINTKIDDDMVSNIFTHASMYRKIYISA